MKYLFEVSWEVCNLVGGIYTVLRSKAPQAVEEFGSNYYLLGPLLDNNSDFTATDEPGWKPLRRALENKGLHCRFGRWEVDGRPKVVLVDFKDRQSPDKILFNYWQQFGVDSLSGGWDYIEPVLFSTACGEVIEGIYDEIASEAAAVAHFHEWMCGGGLLYLKKHAPEIGTVFTTHATVLGRSMASAGMDVYSAAGDIEVEQKAKSFGVYAKHSMEITCAREADSFTTVSPVTSDEAAAILERRPHYVVCNGLDANGLPDFDEQRREAHQTRKALLDLAASILRKTLPKNTRLFITSGRYEFHNKGFDIFLEALKLLDEEIRDDITVPQVVAWFVIATDNRGGMDFTGGDGETYLSHRVHNEEHDPILRACRRLGLRNGKENKVNVIFTPAYLDGGDGVINVPYGTVLPAFDVGVFPSYYEPWGYTPLESIAAGVPTITTDMAGFGRWAMNLEGDWQTSISVIPRAGKPFEEVTAAVAETLARLSRLGGQGLANLRASARQSATRAAWHTFFQGYMHAYEQAYNMANKRLNSLDTSTFSDSLYVVYKRAEGIGPHYQTFTVSPALPPEIAGLRTLANNLWWCWHPEAEELFEELDKNTFEECKHNPVRTLGKVAPKQLKKKAADDAYFEKYQRVYGDFETYMAGPGRIYEDGEAISEETPIVYFSMEFGLHECLPIYSGGLGVLSGDHLKSASDLGLPLIGIGLLYRQGYFRQRIDKNGMQHEVYPPWDTASAPISILKDPADQEVRLSVDILDRTVWVRAWKVEVGRVNLYLLDTDLDDNRPADRSIAARLYGGDRTTRIEQEMLLGFAGVQLVEDVLLKNPSVYHLNEGHCGFMLFERIRRFLDKGMSFQEAREAVKATSVFTSHTPVPAGNETFDHGMMRSYFSEFAPKIGVTFDQLMEMGLHRPGSTEEPFSMTVLALKLTSRANGVSRLHGAVCRDMWKDVWKSVSVEEVPITSITNGIHVTSWLGKNLRRLFERYLDVSWDEDHDDEELWKGVDDIPDEILWLEHMSQKAILFEALKKKIRDDYVTRGESSTLISDTLERLDPKALTIGFARRFATYKRSELLFQNREALERLLNNEERPVQILFAGKAHPADPQGKALIQRIVEASLKEEYLGRIIYLENYNMALGRLLTQGVDVWLNTPIRPHEASGTSGMKVAPNGGLNLSIRDGWWDEAYEPGKGWAVESPSIPISTEHKDEMDNAALMAVLEHEIIPLFYEVNEKNVPKKWVGYMKAALKSYCPYFSTMRMVDEYCRKMYLPTAKRGQELITQGGFGIKQLTEWKRKIQARFSTVQIDHVAVSGPDGNAVKSDVTLGIVMFVTPGRLRPEELRAELVIGQGDGERFSEGPSVIPFPNCDTGDNPGQLKFSLSYQIEKSGSFMYAVRVVPVHALLSSTQETGLVLWG
jgi:phosphorylase/glycogen(starch) synthase